MGIEDVHLRFSGENGTDFIESMITTIADSLVFENHGSLSDDEKMAFRWGFRYGVHNILGLLDQAHDKSPEAFHVVGKILEEAVAAWDIKMCAKLAHFEVDSDGVKPDGVTEH